MRPAFASTRQAAAFALLLLVLLLLPAFMTRSWLPPREEIYSSVWWANGAFPYIDRQIYAEKGDIDIAFLGASHMWNGIDTPYVQQQLSEKLGRPATVRTIAWGGSSYDLLYLITRDLLEHRKVHMLVFQDSSSDTNLPHSLVSHLFRWGDDPGTLDGLSLRYKAIYYFAAIFGMPRNLLSLVRDNIPAKLDPSEKHYWEILTHADNIPAHLGAMASEWGYTAEGGEHAPFVPFDPAIGNQPSDVSVYSPATKDTFAFTGPDLPAWQLHFARKFAALSAQYHCKFVLIHVPVVDEMRDPVIHEREYWPDALQADITMAGIPSAKLFAGLTDGDVLKLFENEGHLNKNGQKYFTRILTPTLLDIYDTQVAH